MIKKEIFSANKKSIYIGGFILVMVFAFNLWRSQYTFYGYDEVYYSALPYSFALGKQPFDYMCSLHELPALIIFPFIFLWKIITGGTMVGVLIYLRLLYCGSLFLISLYLYITFKRETTFDIIISALICCVFMLHTPFNVYTLSYNTIPYLALMASALLLYNGINKNKKLLVFWGGVLYAIAVQAYPMLIISVIIPIIFIVIYGLDRATSSIIKNIILFFSGSIAVLSILLGIVYYFDGFKNLLDTVTGDNVHVNKSEIAAGNPIIAWIVNIYQAICAISPRSVTILILFTLLSIVMLWEKWRKNKYVMIIFFSLWIGIFFYYIWAVWLYCEKSTVTFSGYLLFPCMVLFPAMFLISGGKEKMWLLLYVLGCIYSFSILISSINSDFACSMYGFIFSTMACLGCFKNFVKNDMIKFRQLGQGSMVAICIVIIFSMLYSKYTYLYREASFQSLNSRIDLGPAKGVITSEEKERGYRGLYEELIRIDKNAGNICFGDGFPLGYLCVQNRPNCRSILSVDPAVENNSAYYEKKGYPDTVYILKKEIPGFEGSVLNVIDQESTKFAQKLNSKAYVKTQTDNFYVYQKRGE